MKSFLWVAAILLALPVAGSPAPQQAESSDLSWAYIAPDKVQPGPPVDDSAVVQLPGSAKTYPRVQLHDLGLLKNPPDWFPEEHPSMPGVVLHGDGKSVLACASCHLASGLGHPESANLTGLTADYMLHQLADLKPARETHGPCWPAPRTSPTRMPRPRANGLQHSR
jgi:hypothetical protein